MPTAYLSPSQLKELTDVSVNPGSGQNGYPLVWNNTTGKWEASNISQGSISLVNGGQSFDNAIGPPSTNQSYLAINYSGVPPSPLTVGGAFVPAYGQFAVIANGPSDPRSGFGMFGPSGRPLFFFAGPAASGMSCQTGAFFIDVQNPNNLAQVAGIAFYPDGRLSTNVAVPSTSSTSGAFTTPGGIGIGGNGTFGGYLRMENSNPPASQNAPGLPGQMARDSSYFYICIGTDNWTRIPLSW